MSDHIMIDIETLGTVPGSVILSIGAIPFTEDATWRDNAFFTCISLENSLKRGFKVNAATMKFWLRQEKAAIDAAFFDRKSENIEEALLKFSNYIRRFGTDVRVWGYGANFDIVLLEEAYDKLSLPLPWSHRNIRCARTIIRLSDTRLTKTDGMLQHHPIDDCAHQILELQAAMAKLRMTLDHDSLY